MSVNNLWSHIFGNQRIARIPELISELLNTIIRIYSKYAMKNTDSKIFDIANCISCKPKLLDVELLIWIIHYYQTAKTRTLYESTDGPAGRPTDDPTNSGRLGDFDQTVPELMVPVCWQPGPPNWQRFGFYLGPDPNRQSQNVANTIYRLARAMYSNIVGQLHLGVGWIERRVFGIIHPWANHKSPHRWMDFVQLFSFKSFQVHTGKQFEDIVGRNEESYREGDCWAHNQTEKGNSC